MQATNPPPSIIFGKKIATTDGHVYNGHFTNVENSNNQNVGPSVNSVKDDYFDYEEYGDDDEYYDYDEDRYEENPRNANYGFNSTSLTQRPTGPSQSNKFHHHPTAQPPPRMPQRVTSDRRNSYMHYNFHGTYLPPAPTQSSTHHNSYHHINRRPHRYYCTIFMYGLSHTLSKKCIPCYNLH